jgi:hypothetical protein
MAGIRRKGEAFYCTFRFQGRRHHFTVGTLPGFSVIQNDQSGSDLGGLDFGGITPVSNGGCKTLLGGVRFGRLEKRSQALLGSNLTRDIQADGASMARPASCGKPSEAVAFERHWTPERFLKKSCGESAYLPSTYAAHGSA